MESNKETKYRFFLLCGVIAPIILGIAIVVAGHLTPDYDQITDSISKMGIPGRPYAWLLHGGYYVYALLMSIAAYGLCRTMDSVPGASNLVKLLGIHALGTMLLAVFPDSDNSIFKHLVHDVMSVAAYLPLIIGIFISRSLARREIILKTAGILGVFIIVVNIPMPVINLVNPLSLVGGLLQRMLSGLSYLWLALIFYLLYRRSLVIERQSRFTGMTYLPGKIESIPAPSDSR